jgi:hypothetical protein
MTKEEREEINLRCYQHEVEMMHARIARECMKHEIGTGREVGSVFTYSAPLPPPQLSIRQIAVMNFIGRTDA